MKGIKKLKRILAVMTVAVTMTVMLSATAMAAPAGSTSPKVERGGDADVTSSSEYAPSRIWHSPRILPKTKGSSDSYDPLQIIEEQTEHYYVKGSGKPVTITCNGEYSKFFSIFVDGVFLEKTYYTVERGSTVLTIMPEYLDTLPVGAHEVTLNYTYGSVDTTLNVVESDPNAPQNSVSNQNNNNASAGNSNAASTGNAAAPKTGDASAILLWSMVVLASGCSCVVLVRRKRINSR